MKESVDMILLAMNDLKWQELRDMLLAFGEEQYRLGFLDGEASAINREAEFADPAACPDDLCLHEDGRCLVGFDAQALETGTGEELAAALAKPSHSCEDFTYRGVPCPHCKSEEPQEIGGVCV